MSKREVFSQQKSCNIYGLCRLQEIYQEEDPPDTELRQEPQLSHSRSGPSSDPIFFLQRKLISFLNYNFNLFNCNFWDVSGLG